MKNESGRTLVEMMGTLAIMGILSVAGVWVYGVAMDKLRANEIINEAQKRAVVVAGQIGFQGKTNPTLVEFSDNTFAGGTFSRDVATNGLYQEFGIQVSNVPKRICENILHSIGDSTPIRRLSKEINSTVALTTCSEDNSFLMIYNNDTSAIENDVTYCDNCDCQTVCGQCVLKDGAPVCVNECPIGETECHTHSDCPGDCTGCVKQNVQDETGTCQSCQRAEYLESDGTQIIHSGVTFDSSKDFEVSMNVYFPSTISSSRWFFFGNYPQSKTSLELMKGNENALRMWIYGGNSDVRSSALIDYKDKKLLYHFEHKAQDNSYSASMNGTSVSGTNKTVYKDNQGFALFRDYRGIGTFGAMRIYDMQMRQNGSIVRDFVPVHAPFNEATKQNCMFDKVSKALFCNMNNGVDFTIPENP